MRKRISNEHLVAYGGIYYSYPISQCIANAVWDVLFENGNGDLRKGGDLLTKHFLSQGSTQEPHQLLKRLCGMTLNDIIDKY